VQLVCFSDDERFLLTVGVKKDGKMVAWDLVSGCIVASALAGKNNAAATCACWGGRKKDVKRRDTMQLQLATGGEGFLKYWTLDPAGGSLSSEEATTAVSRHVTALAFSHEREYLYAGSSSGDFVTILVRSLLMHSVTAAASNSVSALAPLPPVPRSLSVLGGDDTLERLLVAGGDGSCTVWQGDGRAYRRTESLEPKLPGAISALSLRVRHPAAGSTMRLLLGTRRGTIHEASLAPGASDAGESGARLLQESHCSAVRGVAYAPHSSTAFVSASDDGSVRLWDVASLSVVAKGECQTALALVPACVAFTGEAIFTGWADGKLRAHDAEGASASLLPPPRLRPDTLGPQPSALAARAPAAPAPCPPERHRNRRGAAMDARRRPPERRHHDGDLAQRKIHRDGRRKRRGEGAPRRVAFAPGVANERASPR